MNDKLWDKIDNELDNRTSREGMSKDEAERIAGMPIEDALDALGMGSDPDVDAIIKDLETV